MEQKERLNFLIEQLWQELEPAWQDRLEQKGLSGWPLLRALMNIRPPQAVSAEFLQVQDAFLQEMIAERGITSIGELTPVQDKLYLWQGDITTLAADAIVNAANEALLGCLHPLHGCIDNIIHSLAGIQLRLACQKLMLAQGHPEAAGQAKITSAFNLPSRYVLHTVGPIITGRVTAKDRCSLASCYRSCLDLAEQYQLESVAFCCISTGVFHFPNQQAAEIAVNSVRQWLPKAQYVQKVIFNVFKDEDRVIYEALLGE